jgi:aldehyde:ferredoxin oxidoreductase
MFNKREIPDFGRKYDYPPLRFYEEPIPSGPNKGHKVDFAVIEEMLDAYYKARGWDENGIPTKETLEKFNLAVE